ncbi:uncharacterized protein LOC661830 isoform X5 [Tribolium castaneum]|uniref:uncharacterized protein LOC661830 isoform X5 n=1 Tax=Tribolium castaneum TaxID=7070 RepID=UPI00077DE248|nr:PREDICTED: uncharacterized protein LOC661830 isoform X5 [Tribolium castaneum]|eukprot:XP_015840690.1 PREDICTED: uncharacterized protein LOC661830 isoform X5 [Tribolium castaneum]
MLNCTDLECILHHHHYYAHLHHLKHGTHVEEGAMSTETEGISDETIRGLLNDTDAPNESLYMIGGVCVAMFMVGVIIVLLAVTISKLRKREEHSNSVHPADVVLHQTTPAAATQTPTAPQALQPDPLAYRGQFLWQYPPPPPQPYMYNNDQDTLVQNLPTERPGFVRGFRKNLGGRWRRLVKRKPPTEVYTIPAELKPQLKQIYVY